MRTMTLLAIGLATAFAGSALADNPPKADKPAKTDKADKSTKATKGTKPAKLTCEEFIALEDVAKPKLVYWAEGFNRKGQAEDAVFDVDTTEQIVPIMIEVCKKEPKASFWKKVKEEFKKIF